METNGGQHWPVLQLVGFHRSPHNEGRPSAAHPKRRPPPSAAATFLGLTLCGDLWIPTRCSTGQCCPPLVSTCTTYYTLLVVFPSISYGREVPRYTVHILCQSLCIWGPSYHEGRRIHPVPKTMYWMSLVSRRTPNTQLSTPQDPVFDPLASLGTSNTHLSAPQNRVLDALSTAKGSEYTTFQNSCFGVSLGSAHRRSSTILHSNLQADPP